MKVYNTMITKEYVPHWTVTDGVREYIANALDGEAPFKYEIGDDYIEIISVGITLDISCFLLGNSSNRKNSNAVGTHGEGSLVGFVPLLREGKSITIFNGDLVWTPEFVLDHNYGKEVLVINEEREYTNNKDYRVVISNLTETELKTIVENCLYLQDEDSLGNFSTAKCGSRVFWEKSGKVYVGGLFVCNTDLSYTYDFAPSKLPLNRDRKQVDSWNLRGETARVLQEVADATKILELAKKEAEDVNHFQYSWRARHEDAASLAYEDFKEKYGEESVVAENYDEMIRLQKEGYVNVVVVDKEAYRELIVSSDEYKKYFNSIELEEVEDKSPLELLEDWYQEEPNSCGSWIEFEKILNQFKDRGVEWVR
jgi:hypothetical protein